LLNQSVVVENRPGGGTVVGTAAVAAAKPDGYTLLLVSPAHTINPYITKSLPYDPLNDFTPIGQITRSAYVLVTSPQSRFKAVGDFKPASQSGQKMSYACLAPAARRIWRGRCWRRCWARRSCIFRIRVAGRPWSES